MKAAIARIVGSPLSIEDVQISKPEADEVLVRVGATGLCHSDLHVLDGTLDYPTPIVLGHEVAGVVEQVGSNVKTVRPGDHVVACITFHCGHCPQCHGGNSHRCRTPEARRPDEAEPRLHQSGSAIQQFLNVGSFAEMILVHQSGCVAIDRDMPLDRACLIGCGVTTGFGSVTRAARLKPGQTVAIIGCGGVGLAAVNAALISGAGRIFAIDRLQSKLDLAQIMGATDTVNAVSGNTAAAVMEMTNGRGVDHVIEAIGLKDTIETGYAMLAAGGTLTIAGATSPDTLIEIPSINLLLSEKRIQGTYMGGVQLSIDVPAYVSLYRQGRLKLDELVSQRLPLERINEGFDAMRSGNIARSVIVFDT